MFLKKIYVQVFEDGSLNAYASEKELLDESNDDEVFAVYELKQTGFIKYERKLVMDKPVKEK